MAHAIHGYSGACKNIHGHSYELHVTVTASRKVEKYIPAPGFIVDFKDLKKIVNEYVIQSFDHKLILSTDYLKAHKEIHLQENLVAWEAEPSAENILLVIRELLLDKLQDGVKLVKLKLYETKDSFAEWIYDWV